MEDLIKIQQELKAPKSQFNSYGKYNYRNCEDILEAVKPLLAKAGMVLIITDDIVQVGDRYYVKATAWLTKDGNQVAKASAFAREAEIKKGMDESQITGTASSYARKYCLNGLFLIDDTKDADTDEYASRTKSKKNDEEKGEQTAKTYKTDFREVRAKIAEIDDVNELTKYWLSLSLSEVQAKILKGDFTRRKEELQRGEA